MTKFGLNSVRMLRCKIGDFYSDWGNGEEEKNLGEICLCGNPGKFVKWLREREENDQIMVKVVFFGRG